MAKASPAKKSRPAEKATAAASKSAKKPKLVEAEAIIDDEIVEEGGESNCPFKNPEYSAIMDAKRKKWKNFKQITDALKTSSEPINYWTIEAPPSIRPRNKYCDITGLPAKYTDPQSGLRYHSASVFQYIKGLSTNAIQNYLQLRNAGVVLK